MWQFRSFVGSAVIMEAVKPKKEGALSTRPDRHKCKFTELAKFWPQHDDFVATKATDATCRPSKI